MQAPTPSPVRQLAGNSAGRDFVVSDIHGHFDKLDAGLAAQGFDPSRDRLFAVGDLIDRGPQSPRALEFLAQPWFFSVRGNHEQAMLDWLSHLLADAPAAELRDVTARHALIGGDWALPMMTAALRGSRTEIQRWHDALAALPVALEISRRGQRIGIVHATVPGGDWNAFCAALGDSALPGIANTALWSRTPVQDAEAETGVRGIDTVFVGHNRVNEPVNIGNLHMIETGAWAGNALTLIDLDRWPAREATLAERMRGWFRRRPGD